MRSIRFSLIITTLSMALIPIILIAVILFNQMNNIFDEEVQNSLAHNDKALTYYLDQKLAIAQDEADQYAMSPDLAGALKDRKRSKLTAIADPIYASLAKIINITVFEFGDANGRVYYRAHNPAKFGDDKSDKAGIKSALAGKAVSGFEFGSSGLGARVFVPMIYNDEIVGTLQLGFNMNAAMMEQITHYLEGDIRFYDHDVLVLSNHDGDDDKIGQLTVSDAFNQVDATGPFYKITDDKAYEAYYLPMLDSTGKTLNGIVEILRDHTHINSYKQRFLMITLLALLVFTVTSVIIALYFTGSITKPINQIITTNQAIADGQLKRSGDAKKMAYREMQTIVDSVEHMRTSLVEMIHNMATTASQLTSNANGLKQFSHSTLSATDQVNLAIDDIAKATTAQAEYTENVMMHMSELDSSVQATDQAMASIQAESDKMSSASESALQSVNQLVTISQQSQDSLDVIAASTEQTNQFANQIVAATTIIASIAEETNLLSLNASIEAARAGEAGRGFSVVAEQIKKLAEQSQASTADIEATIQSLLKNSNDAVKAVERMQTVAKEQVSSVKLTKNAYQQVSAGIGQTDLQVEQVAAAIKKLDDVRSSIVDMVNNLSAISEENAASSQETSATTTELANAIEQLDRQAEDLNDIANQLTENVSRFTI